MRRPPRAAERRRAATKDANQAARARGDYSAAYRNSERADQLEAVETRVIGWLVSKALGDAWRWEPERGEYRPTYRIVHRETGAALAWRRHWNDNKRYQITPENIYREVSSITVSAERTPADIAADIERRLIGTKLFAESQKRLSATTKQRREEVNRRLQCLAVARAYGGRIDTERRWKSQGYPEATIVHFGPANPDSSWRHEAGISARIGYGGVELEINTSNTELAVKVAELVRSYYDKP